MIVGVDLLIVAALALVGYVGYRIGRWSKK